MTDWLLNRLKEPSTWRGLVAVATGLGVGITPAMAEQIIAVGLSVVGLINIAKRDAKSPDS